MGIEKAAVAWKDGFSRVYWWPVASGRFPVAGGQLVEAIVYPLYKLINSFEPDARASCRAPV